jgi:carboxyl-terminal processing protease
MLRIRILALVTIAVSLFSTLAFGQAAPANPHAPVFAGHPASVGRMNQETKDQVLSKVNEIVEKTAFVPGVDFTKWPDFVKSQKEDIDKAQTERQFATAVNKALRQFGFSHIVLATPEAAQARLNRQSVGVGILLQPEPEGLRVLNVFAGSPAAEAGMQGGDLILLGDGKKPESPLDLQGEEGTTLTLRVKHANGKVQDYKLRRRKYSNVRPETLAWPTKETAVLKINTFDLSYDRSRVETLMQKAAPAKNLIVDLRSNPGGAILNLTHLMGLLLPPGTPLGTFISRYTVDKYKKEAAGNPTDLAAIARWSQSKLRASNDHIPPYKGHIAVLINGGSGSAAEIAAAALRDQVDAPIVGTKSAGAVLVSVMAPLPDGFMLQYPITDFVTVNGVRLEGTGVVPVLETPGIVKYNEADPAIEKALLLLQRAELRDDRTTSSIGH